MSETDRPFAALPKPEPDEAPAKEPRARRGFAEGAFGIFLLVILASLAGGLIATYWPWMRSSADTSDMGDRLSALETRVGQMAAGQAPKAAASAFEAERRDLAALKQRVDADEARLTGLEKSGAQTGDVTQPAGQDEIQKTLAQLTKDSEDRAKAQTDLGNRVAALEHSAPPSDLVQRLDSFALKEGEAAQDARIAKLESQDPTGTLRRAASVLALAGLVRASESDAPFAAELQTLRALAPSSELSDLARYSKGVPTRAMLSEQFSAQADSILAAERRSNADSWPEKLWASFVNLVSVRRIGNVKGDDTESRLARAEFDLKAGDLDHAVMEVSGFVGPARDAAAPWLKQAKARLAITHDTQAITNRLIAGLPQ